MPEAEERKRVLGRNEPGVFDHNVETMGSFKAYGSGLNRFSGPATFEKWLEIPHRDADPTAWGTNQRGRCFFHTTPNLFKFWDGTQFLGLVAGPVTGFSEGAIPFGRAGGGFLTQDVTKLFFTDGTDTLNVVGTIDLTGSLDVTGDSDLDGTVVINESNADKDFRVEGSGATYTHLLFTDAGNNRVGVNEDAPVCLVHARLGTCADYAGINADHTIMLLEGATNVMLQLQAATTGSAYIIFADDNYNPSAGMINYDFANDWLEFGIGTNILVYFKTTGAIFHQDSMELDSTGVAAFIANAHNADAYFSLEEDEAIKWSMGFDYSDSLKFQISEGIPGTNVVFEIPTGQGSLHFMRAADKGLQYLDTGLDMRWMFRVATGTNVVEILNRASHGKIEIHANTGTAGAGGDTLVATFEDDLITLAADLRLSSNKELRFYDNGNYVGFEAPALSADQIWVLPSADGPANEVLGTDNSGNLIWRTHDELAGFVASEHLAALDEDNMVSDSNINVATQQSIKAYADNEKANKTTGAWAKSIGGGGDYADWATMIAAMPDLIAHTVSVTIEAGTILTEICNIKNKHGITLSGSIIIRAEKYFPTSGVIPTADSATATTLRDAALSAAALGNDYFNGCWVFIVDGAGTDNGFVTITDYVDATGDIVIAAWPGTQPDNTSRYIVVGVLIEGGGSINYGFDIRSNTTLIQMFGIGINDHDLYGMHVLYRNHMEMYYCGIYGADYSGIYYGANNMLLLRYCGIVNCNTDNNAWHGGITIWGTQYATILTNGISDNNRRGIYITGNSFASIPNNFGDGNGTWGTYCDGSGQAQLSGIECSGSSGNHSDPGTAGNANADQAAAY